MSRKNNMRKSKKKRKSPSKLHAPICKEVIDNNYQEDTMLDFIINTDDYKTVLALLLFSLLFVLVLYKLST